MSQHQPKEIERTSTTLQTRQFLQYSTRTFPEKESGTANMLFFCFPLRGPLLVLVDFRHFRVQKCVCVVGGRDTRCELGDG